MNRKHRDIVLYSFLCLVCFGILWFYFKSLTYANKGMFLFAFVLPLLAIFYSIRKNKLHASVKVSSTVNFFQLSDLRYHLFNYLSKTLRFLAITFLIIAIARPQSSNSWQDRITEGIDIVLAMDISFSMLAKDFEPDRLEGSKNVALNFIKERPHDRIGLVVYEGEAFTQVPLTTDHRVLQNVFASVKPGLLTSGTAIGMGLATAVNRLKESDAASKIIILLTDGVNNQGTISPITAAEIASEFGVRVYTIGVGSKGSALSPVQYAPNGRDFIYKRVPVEIDEETLQKIAEQTDGKYFRATDNRTLAQVYEEIDQLEKTRMKVTEHSSRTDLYFKFARFAFILLGIELILRLFFLRTTP